MANQIPFAQFGLEEAVEQQMVIWMENLTSAFTGQQTGGEQPEIKVASLYNKLQIPAYPFIGVRAHMPVWEPSMIQDYESQDTTTEFPVFSKFNEILINLHLEAKEYRQIQRLYSYIQMIMEYSYNPLNPNFIATGIKETWLSEVRNWGLVINGWTATPVVPVIQDVPNNDTRVNYDRTDVFALFQRDINLNATLNTRVILSPVIPIAEIDQNLTIILPG